MKRLPLAPTFLALVLGSLVLAAFVSAVGTVPDDEARFARGRALFEGGQYLEALDAFRELQKSGHESSQTRAFVGAAYLRLHLYKAAIRELDAALDQEPDQWDARVALAQAHLHLGDLTRAGEQAERAIATNEKSVDAWTFLGQARWGQHSFAEAEKAGLKAQEVQPGNLDAAELLLHVYFDQNQSERFETILGRLENPGTGIQDLVVSYFVRQGEFRRAYDFQVRFRRAQTERSILTAELGVDRDPAGTDLYPKLVRDLVQAGRFEDAIRYGLAYRGDNSRVELELGKAFWKSDRHSEAARHFSRASAAGVHKLSAEIALGVLTGDLRHWREAFTAERVERDPFILAEVEAVLASDRPLMRALAWRYASIYDPGLYNRCADEALKAVEASPRDLEALLTLGTAYHRLERFDEAVRYLDRARALAPQNPEPHSRLGNVAISKKDAAGALAHMNRAVALDARNAGNLYNLGWLYEQLGETGRAADLYRRAIEASPLTFEAMNNLALIHDNQRQHDLAVRLLERAIRIDSESEVSYFNLANHYARREEWKRALDNYDLALSANPASGPTLTERGRAFLKMGRAELAVQSLNSALERSAEDDEAYVLLSTAYETMGRSHEAIAAAEEGLRIRPEDKKLQEHLDRLKSQRHETN